MALAAVAHEKCDKVGERHQSRAVHDRPPFAPGLDKPRLFEMAKVKGHARGGRAVHRLSDGASGHPFGAGCHQTTDDAEPCFLRKRGEGVEGLLFVHCHLNIPRVIEISDIPRVGATPAHAANF